jgi:hypothetical protein
MLMSLGEYKLVEFVYKRFVQSKESDICAIIISTDNSYRLHEQFILSHLLSR